ncbi:NADH-quinone oxidoreductase subunit NuoN [Trueperella bialowiezensis]|uniref:NADH-quinone oxidoreductase subunit N n=1 Tax=Trueperella bialowiezensis TaxID=312285 RepID=A0A3S4X6H6_9ACTO|nr:NADH-quinone oxidoreductase subunit NuoN [Trueperella bialowiezensis]VEI13711.1 NADH-quinone oxidoreductase subunit N [Trueperella bialowiezensis]
MNFHIEWVAVIPLLIVLGAGVVGTLVEAFVPHRFRRPIQIAGSLISLAAALVAVVWRWTELQAANIQAQALSSSPLPAHPLAGMPGTGFEGVPTGIQSVGLVEDNISLIGQAIILTSALLAFLVMADRSETREGAFAASAATRPGSPDEREMTKAGRQQTEIFPLAMFATGGMMAFTSAYDLLTLFISLEVLSLPLYVLAATSRRKRLLSQEAALKYFILGAFSSAIFLMGAALIYGATGSLSLVGAVIRFRFGPGGDFTALLAVGAIMVLIGLLFKVGAVPFHSWTPDVYQGAPTPITGFMAAGTKAAAFLAMARVFFWTASLVHDSVNVFMWIVIIATIVVGTVMGLIQTDIKRLLAYSSIAHAGFILIAINAINHPNGSEATTQLAFTSIMFYLLAYGVATVGAFGIVTLVREKDANGNILGEATKLSSWAGLGKRSPLLAAAMSLFLLSFAGIPLTGGFIGKFRVFQAGVGTGQTVLVVIAVLASAATAVFYFRLIQLMYFREPEGETTVAVESEGMSIVAIIMATILTVALGVLPGPVLDFINGSFV